MKKITLLLAVWLGISYSYSQTSLSAGDIAFMGSNVEGTLNTDDTVSFVLLTDIDAATEIIFTDRGWDNTAGAFTNFNGDGEFIWISGIDRSAGEIVTIDMGPLFPAAFALIGDQLFAIQGSIAAPTFIAGLQFNEIATGGSDANWDGEATTNSTSELPPGLTTGDTAVRLITAGGMEQDNWQFSCALAGSSPIIGDAAVIRAVLHNRANWNSSDIAAYDPAVEAGCMIIVGSIPPIPTVTVDQAASQADPIDVSPIDFTAEFSEAVTGFDASDVVISGTANATTALVTPVSAEIYTISISGMTNSGTVIVTVPAGGAQDLDGNLNEASTSTDNEVTFNFALPTVTVDQAATQADPIAVSPIDFTAVFSKAVTGFDGSDVTISGTANATTAVVTPVSAEEYTITVSGMTNDGTVIVTIPAGGAQDIDGNFNEASTSTDNEVTYDTTSPSVTIDQAPSQDDPTGSSPIHFVVEFSESVVGFNGGDVLLGGTAIPSTVNVTGAGSSYDVFVSGMLSDGTVTASIPAGSATDAAGNTNDASTSTDNEVSFFIPPTVRVDQAASQADPIDVSPIDFTAEFSEAVTGFDASDVVISGTANATTALVTPVSAEIYTISISGMTNSGTVIVTVPAGGAQDLDGNLNEASTSTDNEVTFNFALPTVTVDQAATQADPIAVSPIDFTAVFSKAVTGFDGSDVTISGTANATTAVVTPVSAEEYTITVSGMTNDGTVIVTIPAGGAQDIDGNFNEASTSTDNEVTYDTTGPTVTAEQAAAQTDPTGTSPIHFVVQFSESVVGFSAGDVTLGGTANPTTVNVTGAGSSYDVFVSGMTSDGTVTVIINEGVATDTAGNLNQASTSTDNEVTYDTSPPALTITGFVLVNADTNMNIMPISDGDVIDVAALTTMNLNIRADATMDTESVQLVLSGSQSNTRTENVAPFALFGDVSGNYGPHVFAIGTYNLSATPYSADLLGGMAGSTASVSFEVVNNTLGSPLILVDSSTDAQIMVLTDGAVINKSVLGDLLFGVIYNASLNPNGVTFNLSGPISESRSEGTSPPYSLFGDLGVDIQGKKFPAGDYTLVANPNSGPSVMVQFTVVDEDPACAVFDAFVDDTTDPSTCDGSDGEIQVGVSGFAAPLTFNWSHDMGLNNATALGLTSGTYTVTVTDDNGCSETLMITLDDPPSPIVTFTALPDLFITDGEQAVPGGGTPTGGVYSGPGVTDDGNGMTYSFDPAVAGVGVHTITYSFTDGNGCTGTASDDVEVTDPTAVLSITGFALVNADTDMDIFPLMEGSVIDLSGLTTSNLNIRANATSDIESVRLQLTGTVSHSMTENFAPYALFGDFSGDYIPGSLQAGSYTLTATPYSGDGLGGTMGTTTTINFSVIEGGGGFFLKLYPNPAITEIQVEMVDTKEETEIFAIQVHDMHGRLVKSYNVRELWGSNQFSMPVTYMQAGVYTMTLVGNKGTVQKKAFVVNR